MLNIDKSQFIDFQKVRIQETQAELPRGCIPRSVEVILRAENVETVQVINCFKILNIGNYRVLKKILYLETHFL